MFSGVRNIAILVEPALAYSGTAVAGSGSAITPATLIGLVVRAVSPAAAVMGALGIAGAFHTQTTLISHDAMLFDLLANSRFVFAKKLGNSGFC